jgi:WAS/WASL-interacting protein
MSIARQQRALHVDVVHRQRARSRARASPVLVSLDARAARAERAHRDSRATLDASKRSTLDARPRASSVVVASRRNLPPRASSRRRRRRRPAAPVRLRRRRDVAVGATPTRSRRPDGAIARVTIRRARRFFFSPASRPAAPRDRSTPRRRVARQSVAKRRDRRRFASL